MGAAPATSINQAVKVLQQESPHVDYKDGSLHAMDL